MAPVLLVIALAAVTTGLVKWWFSLFESTAIAAAIWIGTCLLYAAIYDRRTKQRLRESTPAQTEARPECSRADLLPPPS